MAACFLMVTGAFLLWQGHAADTSGLPAVPAKFAGTGISPTPLLAVSDTIRPPEATPKSREEKRFSRADRNKDGRIEIEELLQPRRKAFAKLDTNGDGKLNFEEWATKTLTKVKDADADGSGWLSPAEYASTAPPPPKRRATCSC
ncbi:EF-hand domain-containing protein [Sphingomonas sediminicola]|uniref:EF-hand domain-containing protein n=1 Tax=Sphingomonas sediminicola TaxID=386874 RepID=UPI001F0809D4|nr:EF-hand domain-containing protein ['Sphingomonas ginsengisoli' Hoang et al. 2012]